MKLVNDIHKGNWYVVNYYPSLYDSELIEILGLFNNYFEADIFRNAYNDKLGKNAYVFSEFQIQGLHNT